MSTTTEVLKTWAEIKDIGDKVAQMFFLLNVLGGDKMPEEAKPLLDSVGEEVKKIVKDFEAHEMALYALVDQIEEKQ